MVRGAAAEVRSLLQEGLALGFPPRALVTALMDGMERVAELFRTGEFCVPEVLVAARAVRTGLGVLVPHFRSAQEQKAGTLVLGTVQGDLHDIGKTLVGIVFQGAGYEVVDLGVDVAPERFVQAVADYRPHLLGLSALLTYTMKHMKRTIRALAEAGLRPQVRVLVGGAPVTAEFARDIGADGYADDAFAALEVATSLLHTPRRGKRLRVRRSEPVARCRTWPAVL
ncbi:MAG: corrinoid protein [Bacillota bacterium]